MIGLYAGMHIARTWDPNDEEAMEEMRAVLRWFGSLGLYLYVSSGEFAVCGAAGPTVDPRCAKRQCSYVWLR